MIWLRQSTANQIVPLGPFLDSTDGDSEEIALTINAADILIWKKGATTLAAKNSGGATHIQNGVYYATLDATDTNTAGPLVLYSHPTGALFFRQVAMVLPANVYDSLVLGTDYLSANVVEWAGETATTQNTAAAVVSTVNAGAITVYRGTTWSIQITGLGTISAYDVIYFSVKRRISDPDTAAILRVKNTASGLERFNQQSPTSAANGTITIDDAGAGNITITVNEAETQNASPESGLFYDIKGVDNDGSVVLLSSGTQFTIGGDVTRAIT